LDNCKFHVIKDERLVSKMEGKTNFFKAPETVRWLDLTDPDPHRPTLRYCHKVQLLVFAVKDKGGKPSVRITRTPGGAWPPNRLTPPTKGVEFEHLGGRK